MLKMSTGRFTIAEMDGGEEERDDGMCVCVVCTISRKLPFFVWKPQGLWRLAMLQ